MFNGLRDMLMIRKAHAVFGRARTYILDTGNVHCFAFVRVTEDGNKMLVTANFSEHVQQIDGDILNAVGHQPSQDLLTGASLEGNEGIITLRPYQQAWWMI